MIGPEWEYPIDDITVGTGFSMRRFMIPAACSWDGFAIYLDADQIVFGDIAELLDLGQRAMSSSASTAVTYQPDKFSPKPWPQSSVMVIDCAAAKKEWFWDIEKSLNYLRTHKTKKEYADLMHLIFSARPPGQLPTEWNHLNVYTPGKTKLLHYTSENTQPWYVPTHPLAHLWLPELLSALGRGEVTDDEIRSAVANFNVKEDWRNTNGLHPSYLSLLNSRPFTRGEKPEEAKTFNPLWVTSFSAKLYKDSGKPFIESWAAHDIVGDLMVGLEGNIAAPAMAGKAPLFSSLDNDPFLAAYHRRNAAVIPKEFGGKNSGACTCKDGPLDRHSKDHEPGCVGYYFNYHASRWARKAASLRHALRHVEAEKKNDIIIWVDADCAFQKDITREDIVRWFDKTRSLFYFRATRPVAETGIFGFNLRRDGAAMLRSFLLRYENDLFRKDPRWDDSYQLQQVITQRPSTSTIDLASRVTGHSEVIPNSIVGPFISHAKGRHTRQLGIFK